MKWPKRKPPKPPKARCAPGRHKYKVMRVSDDGVWAYLRCPVCSDTTMQRVN